MVVIYQCETPLSSCLSIDSIKSCRFLLMEWSGRAPCQQRMLAGGTEDKEHAMSQKLDIRPP